MTKWPRVFASVYKGQAENADYQHVGNVVRVLSDSSTRPLDARFDLANHSPTGFAWSYLGSGPAQLALAILADATGDDAFALEHYRTFKFDIIARLAPGDFTLERVAVLDWIAALGDDVVVDWLGEGP